MVISSRAREAGTYRKTTLKNGLRIITEKIPSVRSISIGVWIDIGSRNECPKEAGVSHFIEHMVFKGTKKRSARQIAASLESIGGSLNGFTSREQTCYTARILDEHLDEAIDVLSDIVCHATMTPSNMNRERQVICEEIKESLDNPSDHIHDLFSMTFWGRHPLGQPIMGSQKSIKRITRAQLKAYQQRNYRAGSVLIAASGSISHAKLVELVKESFSFPAGAAEAAESARRSKEQSVNIVQTDNSQTHFCLGFPGYAYNTKDKMPALALNTYLGAGMSSVLFQKIREERGLAYAVYTFHEFYRDSGIFGAYLGTDKTHLGQAFDLILKELALVRKRRLSASVLDRVKAQMKGQVTLNMEATTSRMSRLARQELMTGSHQSLRQILKEIDRVSPSDILRVANQVFDQSKIAIAVLGQADKNIFKNVG